MNTMKPKYYYIRWSDGTTSGTVGDQYENKAEATTAMLEYRRDEKENPSRTKGGKPVPVTFSVEVLDV